MSDIAELKRFVKSLQQASTDQEIVDILQVMKKEAKITEAVLRQSRLAVGKLRSHAAKGSLRTRQRNRAHVEKRRWTRRSMPPGRIQRGPRALFFSSPTAQKLRPRRCHRPPRRPRTTALARQKATVVSTSLTGDKTRDKCIEMLYDALALESGFRTHPNLILQRARTVEETDIQGLQGTTAAYKSKDTNAVCKSQGQEQPWLGAASVTAGDIPAQTFARMSSQEMASEERKAADAKIEEDNLFLSLGAGDKQAETDAFQCGRCKQRKCRYRQAQTRSADEPMTTFVTCTNCNHRWKFS
ncbi:hypothetical protein EI94DRAFT_1909709 [Lactarius quietus]|nr:hypothetical protein EI94DRAFT_1909709 [Lactarius quietus]